MKRHTRYITAPINIWTHPDLTPIEKMVLIDIDSYCVDDFGTVVGAQTIATSLGLPTKDVKDAIKQLYTKSAITLEVDEDGNKKIIPHLNNERYLADHSKAMKDTRKKEADILDYGYIQKQWNTICAGLAQIERFTPRRKLKTRSCLQGCGTTVEGLILAFKLIASSNFLNGSKTDWAASFDWLVKTPDNLQKVLEGNYHKSDYNERKAFERITRGEDTNISATESYYE